MRDNGTFHALAWAWWASAAVVCVHVAPNPVYVVLVVAVALLVVETHRREGPLGRVFELLVTLAAVFVLVRIVLTAVTTSTGGDDVLFTLPSVDLPLWLGGFELGGEVNASVVIHAGVEGVVIVGIIAAFGAFNAVVSHHEIVRSAPRSFHEVGLVVTVALAFVPSTVTAVATVREADRARTGGEVVRRGRLRRTVIPVLESGMERAMLLAESMDARGFAHGGPGPAERRAGWLALGGLLALGGAFVALVGRAPTVALVLGLAGATLVAGAVMVASRASRRARHRPTKPQRIDAAMMGAVSLAPIALGVLAIAGEPSLRWEATATSLPGFHPLVAVALLPLAVPALRSGRTVRSEAGVQAVQERSAA